MGAYIDVNRMCRIPACTGRVCKWHVLIIIRLKICHHALLLQIDSQKRYKKRLIRYSIGSVAEYKWIKPG